MLRPILYSLSAILCFAPFAQAQVFVRAPFVRVYVDGPVWHVRAPFVDIGSSYYYAPPPRIDGTPPVGTALPEPRKVEAPPAGAGVAPTVEEFARSFQAKPGVHDVTIRNPATGEPNKVHFVLPDDTVRRVVFDHTSIEFDYGLLRFVRIDFETKGPVVSAR